MVDASDYAVMVSKKSDFRLHYMTELFSLNATEMYFTSSKEGETLSRYKKIKQNDLIIADRAYGTITGIIHILGYNADFLIRLRSNSFNLYDSDKERFNLTEKLKDWEQGKTLDLNLFFKKGSEYIPIRICALGKTEKELKNMEKKIKKSNNSRKEPSQLQFIWNKYTIIATSLNNDISFNKIMELYRMRW